MTRTSLLLTASTISLLLSAGVAAAAPALPAGGAVAAGSAAISSSGASLTVSQSTPKAIIDWSSFSIGQGGGVQFNNGSGATLNRVTGASGSAIDGLLSGTGSVYLINPNGVIVGKSGEVKVGGSFVASTLGISDSAFLNGGGLIFSGHSTAAVVNEGKVGSLGGDVVLIASSVSNSGSLSAPNGAAGLLAGQSVLLRDQALDDGKFSVLVGGASTSATNSGLIEAANAELRANGGNVYALAGNTAGVIKADGVNQGDGHVWLVADGGSLDVAGTIAARGPNGSGGIIETSGADVKIGASSIDAGVGGTWLVDPYDLTIDSAAAGSISGALNAGTNVTEQTTASGASGYGNQNPSGNGDIFVQAPISWSTGATLTLDAYRNLVITAPITASGAGQAVLLTGSGGSGHLDFGLGASGFAGSLSFTGAEGGGQSLTINGTPYGLIYSMSELAALNGGSANAALATDLNSTTTYGDAVVKTFGGNLEGLGHAVSNLNIGPAGDFIGLFGTLNAPGSISDLGVAGGAVEGENGVGDLVGRNYGAISRAYASGAVNALPGVGNYGGLVGVNAGSISWSHATGDVTVDGSHSGVYTGVGGLVGYTEGIIDHSYANGLVTANNLGDYVGGLAGAAVGSISASYATGDVYGNDSVGGLIGSSSATLANVFATGEVRALYYGGALLGVMGGGSVNGAYALGMVHGAQHLGGFLGRYYGGTLTAAYWDPQTTGMSAGWSQGSPGGIIGLTTAQLQANLPSGFSGSAWGLIPGVSYPYLLDFFPTTPQVLSGKLGSYSGVTRNDPGAFVKATVNGTVVIGHTSAFADSTYYFIGPAGVMPAGSTVVVYSIFPTVIEQVAAGASVTGADIYFTNPAGFVTIKTPDTTVSAMLSDLAKGLGPANSGDNLRFTMPAGQLALDPGASLLMLPQGASFDFDQSLNLGSAIFVLNAAGKVSQSAGGVTAKQLQGSSVGGLSLDGTSNQIMQFSGWSDATGDISLTDGEALSINGAVTGAGVIFKTTSGDLQVSSSVKAGTDGVGLISAGKVVESGTKGFVSSKANLSVASQGGMTMNGTNVSLGTNLTNVGGGAIRYTSYGNLNVNSAENGGGGGAIVLAATLTTGGAGTINIKGGINGSTVTLTSPLGIKETGAGAAITATMLNGSAGGPVTLNGPNMIGRITGFTDTASDFSLKDGEALTLTGTLDGTGRTVSLTTTAGNIAVNGTIDAATLNLTSQAGALTESNTTGAIVAGTLNATAHTGISLGSTHNSITTVGTDHTDSGPNHIQQ